MATVAPNRQRCTPVRNDEQGHRAERVEASPKRAGWIPRRRQTGRVPLTNSQLRWPRRLFVDEAMLLLDGVVDGTYDGRCSPPP